MRTLVTLVFASLLFTSAALAQEKSEFSVFLSDIAGTGIGRVHRYGGLGASFSRMLTPHVSAQVSVASEVHRSYPYFVGFDGTILPATQQDIRTWPVDFVARYHWLNDTRWKPYLGAGLRYVAAPHGVDPGFRYQDHLNAQVVGGLEFLVRPNFGITLDAKQIVGSRETYDPELKFSAGVNWRF